MYFIIFVESAGTLFQKKQSKTKPTNNHTPLSLFFQGWLKKFCFLLRVTFSTLAIF